MTGLPWRWRIVSRLAAAATFITVGTLTCVYIIVTVVLAHVTFTHASAIYVSQKTVSGLITSQLEVKVRFYVHNHPPVITYIHPNYSTLPSTSTRRPIPILYWAPNPSEAFYAGPGGDANFPFTTAEGLVGLGIALIVVGLLLLTSVTTWRRRVLSRARHRGQCRTVHLRWQEEPSQTWPTVVVTNPQGGPDYSWRVLPRGTPIDGTLRFLRSPSRGLRTAGGSVSEQPRPNHAELAGGLAPRQWVLLRSTGDLILPATRAEPVIGTGAPTPRADPGSEGTLVAHRRLLAAYAEILEQVRQLPRFIRPPAELSPPVRDRSRRLRRFARPPVQPGTIPVLPTFRTFLCWRLSVRLHVESHIRRQIRQLGYAYVRAQMLISATSHDADEQRRRLMGLRDECQLVNSSLTDARRRAVSFVILFAAFLPIVPLIAKIPQVQFSRLLQAVLAGILIALIFLPGAFALIAYRDSFRCKKQLFQLYTAPHTSAAHLDAENVYELENTVFGEIDQPKRLERLSDCWAYALVLAALIVVCTEAELLSGPFPVGVLSRIAVAIIAIVSTWWFVATLARRRRDER